MDRQPLSVPITRLMLSMSLDLLSFEAEWGEVYDGLALGFHMKVVKLCCHQGASMGLLLAADGARAPPPSEAEPCISTAP